MTFWIVSLALALVVSALLVVTLLRVRKDAGAEPAAAYDLRVYRDQLRDVDRDLARGLLGEADADRIRAEISRRILAADAQVRCEQSGQAQPGGISVGMALVLVLVVLGGTVGLYLSFGAPGRGDFGLERRLELADILRNERPGQEQAEADMPPELPTELADDYQALIDRLRETVTQRPDDLQGQTLLALHEARSGNFIAAHHAQARVIDLLNDEAGAAEYARLGELQIAAAGGYVSPEAEESLRNALERDPGHGPARFYWGLMLAQTGRPDLAFRIWESTLRRGPPDAPWLEPIRTQIEEMAWRAGVDYSAPPPASEMAPPPLAGPTAQDIEAASDMSAEDRQNMIRSMVDRLSERLAEQGGNAGEWARLIGALGVLGETDRAMAILAEARQTFAGDDAALAAITDAAKSAGLAE